MIKKSNFLLYEQEALHDGTFVKCSSLVAQLQDYTTHSQNGVMMNNRRVCATVLRDYHASS